MIVVQAPLRIGIAGGGTDLPVWANVRIGKCLSLAIKPCVYALLVNRFDHKVVAAYSQIENARRITEIGHGLIRECALNLGVLDGIEVHTVSAITSKGSGLGASSSFAVALIKLFATYCGIILSPIEVATRAWQVEIDRLRRPIGRQDHMAASFGGLRLYRFEKDKAYLEETFTEDDSNWISSVLKLVPLSSGHDACKILENVSSQSMLIPAYDSVEEAVTAIRTRDVERLGRAVSMGMQSKRAIPGAVSSEIEEKIDNIKTTLSVGKLRGIKVCGAGGGGYLLLVVEPGTHVSDVLNYKPSFSGAVCLVEEK